MQTFDLLRGSNPHLLHLSKVENYKELYRIFFLELPSYLFPTVSEVKTSGK